jgi:hypothetical protein
LNPCHHHAPQNTDHPPPSFLPILGNQLQKLFPANHDSISSVLGLVKAFLMHLHLTKPSCGDESADAIAHLLSLFISDMTIQAFLPKGSLSPPRVSAVTIDSCYRDELRLAVT